MSEEKDKLQKTNKELANKLVEIQKKGKLGEEDPSNGKNGKKITKLTTALEQQAVCLRFGTTALILLNIR